MKILVRSSGETYPSIYEWGKEQYWIANVQLMLSKRGLDFNSFGDIKSVYIGDSNNPFNIIRFENGLELYDEVNSPDWAVKENDIALSSYLKSI